MFTKPNLILLLKLLAFLVISFILVHFFAVFGFFCAVAYLIFWIIFPRASFCLFCQIKGVGGQCPVCRRRIHSGGPLYPRTLLSVLMNFGVLLLIFILCAVIVWAEGKIFWQLPFPLKRKTVQFTLPARNTFRIGEIFPMKIEIEGIEDPINLVRADILFENRVLEIVDFNTEDSFANILVQKEIDNDHGFARLVGGIPNPGFMKKSGIFGTVLFKGKSSGLGKVEFLSSSLVLANDGRATNLLKGVSETAFVIVPEKISKAEEKKQSLLIKPSILGERTGTQMQFYDETKVLGEKIALPTKQKPSWPQTVFGAYRRLVEQIFALWGDFLR